MNRCSMKIQVFFLDLHLGRNKLCCMKYELKALTGTQISTLLYKNIIYLDEMVNHTVIKIFTSQVGISGSRFDFKNSILDSQNRDIEGTTTQMENKYIGFGTCTFFLVQTISDSSSSRFCRNKTLIKIPKNTNRGMRKFEF